MGVRVTVATAVIDDTMPENDCAIAIAGRFALLVGVLLVLRTDATTALDRAVVGGENSLSCSERVIVTKELTGESESELKKVATGV